jgi:hypothetical protein
LDGHEGVGEDHNGLQNENAIEWFMYFTVLLVKIVLLVPMILLHTWLACVFLQVFPRIIELYFLLKHPHNKRAEWHAPHSKVCHNPRQILREIEGCGGG